MCPRSLYLFSHPLKPLIGLLNGNMRKLKMSSLSDSGFTAERFTSDAAVLWVLFPEACCAGCLLIFQAQQRAQRWVLNAQHSLSTVNVIPRILGGMMQTLHVRSRRLPNISKLSGYLLESKQWKKCPKRWPQTLILLSEGHEVLSDATALLDYACAEKQGG